MTTVQHDDSISGGGLIRKGKYFTQRNTFITRSRITSDEVTPSSLDMTMPSEIEKCSLTLAGE